MPRCDSIRAEYHTEWYGKFGSMLPGRAMAFLDQKWLETDLEKCILKDTNCGDDMERHRYTAV